MRYWIAITFLLSTANLTAQAIPGEYILDLERLPDNYNLNSFLATAKIENDINIELLSAESGVGFVKGPSQKVLAYLRKHNLAHIAHPNERLHLRNVPNDDRWSEQWNMVTIQALRAWDLVTGGTNYRGDDVVIAVLDEGFNNAHIDIKENIWKNVDEIPGDNIDNDNNGYVDDYLGWNFGTHTDVHKEHEHGLGVVGIIGAKGNNGEGITGLNWDIKIMTLSQALSLESLIRAYQYVYEMRKRYNETGGVEGAYVVATNFSAGLSKRFGSEAAMKPWCRMYDQLGSVGILSIGATANEAVNVDDVGDMPTTCESAYFISVTNSNRDDELDDKTGYGKLHVDLTAPGDNITSLVPGDHYNKVSGTSAAAPHVAGVVGLLHSMQCESVYNESIQEPALHTLKMRQHILRGVYQKDNFKEMVASGGRLDVLEALRELQLDCPEFMVPSKRGALDIEQFFILDNSEIYIEFKSPDERDDYGVMLSDITGRVLFRKDNITPQNFGRKELTIPLPELAVGVYFVTLYKTSGQVTRRFINLR